MWNTEFKMDMWKTILNTGKKVTGIFCSFNYQLYSKLYVSIFDIFFRKCKWDFVQVISFHLMNFFSFTPKQECHIVFSTGVPEFLTRETFKHSLQNFQSTYLWYFQFSYPAPVFWYCTWIKLQNFHNFRLVDQIPYIIFIQQLSVFMKFLPPFILGKCVLICSGMQKCSGYTQCCQFVVFLKCRGSQH